MTHVQKFLPSVSVFAVAVFLVASPAMAGFEWKPPAKVSAPAETSSNALMPDMPAMPRDSIETIDLQAAPTFPVISPRVEDAPVAPPPVLARTKPILTDHPAPALRIPVQQAPSAVVAPETVIPAVADSYNDDYVATPLAAPILTASTPHSTYAEVVGFGSDLPLALAMRQIVPAQFGYAFDASVDQGARVTWNGGKPWDQVLSDAVAPLGLGVSVIDGTVRVLPAAKLAAQAPAMPVAEPMAVVSSPENNEKTREVYVRRHSTAEPVAQQRAPGAAETLSKGVVVTEKKKSSFWSHFGLDSSEKTTLINDNTALTPATSGYTPHRVIAQAPVSTGSVSTPAQGELVARYSEPVSLTQPPGQISASDTGAMNPYAMSYWQAEKGDSLRNVLQSWSDDAGVRLYWVPSADYKLPDAIRLQGSYTDAVTQILGAYNDAPARPVGRLHPNLPMGPSVLIIEPSNG
jgi:hypothetical protein